MRRLLAAMALLAATPLVAQGTARAPIVAWTYTVQSGDTFAQIAQRWGVDMAALGEANGIPSPYVIRIGQVLKRPGPNGVPRPTPMPTPSGAPVVTPKAVPRPAPSPRPAPPLRPP
ncbi:MAG: hypothetical protein B7Y74_05010, partial [Novosphingobium sp. 35-62-5]